MDENMGAVLCKEIASKTNDVVGDGTTTANSTCTGNHFRRYENGQQAQIPCF